MIAYRIILFLAQPFVVGFMVLRALGGRESRTDLRQRFAATANVARQTPTIWLHGASIGEITSARHLIDRLLAQFDGTKIVVTVNTITARDLVDGWGLARVAARLAPLEIGRATERFLDDWNPKALISLENELWPKRFQACKLRNIPVLIAGGRLSERSARRWLRMGGLATKTMQTLDFVAPLDLQNGDQFLALGLPKDRLSPPLNLKATVQLAPLPAGAVDRLNAAFPRAQTILAASTHEGEELGIISAFSEAYKTNPDLRLILAPRHPHRAGSVAALLQAQGLEFSRRSDTAASPADHPVLLADTLGEMALWYSLAGLTVIGGTFTDKGGHTPFEPVQFGSAVVHGPDVANHRPAFDALAAAKGAIALPDLDGLPAVFHRVGKTDWQKMCQKATFALQQLAKHQSDVNPLIESLKKSIRIP